MKKEPKKGESFRRGYQQGVQSERERLLNQKANQHDEEVRQLERERVLKVIEEVIEEMKQVVEQVVERKRRCAKRPYYCDFRGAYMPD